MVSLDELQPGEKAVVRHISPACLLRKRLMDLGLMDGTQIDCLHKARSGDPIAYDIRGAVIALRRRDIHDIEIELIPGGDFA